MRPDALPVRSFLSVGVTVLIMGCGSSPTSAPTSLVGAPAVARGANATNAPAGRDPDGALQPVRLDDMGAARWDPTPEQRNPFRFRAARPVASSDAEDALPPPTTADAPTDRDDPTDEGPATPAPAESSGVPLTFIGFMESPGIEGRVVVLTDGQDTFQGRRGDVIDGRYRILGLGLESVEVERIDGGGRATLRLPNDASGGV